MYRPVLITPPTADVLSLADAKKHLRANDFTDDDDDIRAAIRAAQGEIDPAFDGWLGRALRPQTWELRLNHFPRDPIALPYPPLITLDSLKYDDAADVEQTLVKDTDFRVIGIGSMGKAALAPLYGRYWPSARCDHESVRIRFTCGYPVAAAAHDAVPAVVDMLPEKIVQWMKLRVGDYYEFRESIASGHRNSAPAMLPHFAENMLSHLRVYWGREMLAGTNAVTERGTISPFRVY